MLEEEEEEEEEVCLMLKKKMQFLALSSSVCRQQFVLMVCVLNHSYDTMVKVGRPESVPFLRYFWYCNVLRICNMWATPTYRVYHLYDESKLKEQTACVCKTKLLSPSMTNRELNANYNTHAS